MQIGWIAAATTYADAIDRHDVIDLHALLALVERVVPRRDRCMRAVERERRELDVIERGGSAGDEAAMRSAIRNQRIGMHTVDELIDELIVLFELIGRSKRGRDKRSARHPYR